MLCSHLFARDNGNALFSSKVVKINVSFKYMRENCKEKGSKVVSLSMGITQKIMGLKHRKKD